MSPTRLGIPEHLHLPAPIEQARDLLARLKETKEGVDHAKKVEEGKALVLKAKERKLGDTIKEYKDMVAKSYRQAIEAKKTLTGGVAAQTDAKLREVNGLIDKYNREVKDFQSVMGTGVDIGFSALARVEAPGPKKDKPRYFFYDALLKKQREFANLEDAKKAAKQHASDMDAKYSGGTSATQVWQFEPRELVYTIRCSKGKFSND